MRRAPAVPSIPAIRRRRGDDAHRTPREETSLRGGKKRSVFPFEVVLAAGEAGNELDSIVMPQQIRTISKSRLLERAGILTDSDRRREVEDRMLDHLGISLEDDE